MKFNMKNLATGVIVFCAGQTLQAQVTVSTDFTDVELQRQDMSNIWTVVNRISPRNGPGTRPDLKVNLVRMIGGIKKVADGENVPNLDFDPCTYDTNTGTYVYNWDPLIERFDRIVNSGVAIHQVVLDQPPWAFQHGYTFIPEGTMDGVHFREDERVTTYGNSLPPADKAAYHAFIQALIIKLVDTYGEELVMSWRFRVGSEIETPEHWKGTEQDFIEHFTNTVDAVRSILPDAKIGIHTRKTDFLYKNGTVLNYKGEIIQSFADGLIEHCHDNNVRYDFWGVSDYVIITRDEDIDMAGKYDRLFASLVDHPKWNPDATLDIMEYKTITAMNSADGGGTVACLSSHREIVELGFVQLFYQHADQGLEKIFRWGNRPDSSDPIGISMLNTMNGQARYETQVTGTSAHADNQLDAFFGKHPEGDAFDVLVYNYNGESFDYLPEEGVKLRFTLAQPVGTELEYRCLSYAKENNELQTFLENEPPSGWIKDGFHRYGEPERTLNEAGAAAFSTFVHTNEAVFGPWQTLQSVARTDGKTGSMVQIDTTLDSFAFKKYEFRLVRVEPVLDLLVGWEQWLGAGTSPSTSNNGASGITANDTGWGIHYKGSSADGTFGGLSSNVAPADLTIGTDSSGNAYGGRWVNVPANTDVSIDFVITETLGVGVDLASFHMDLIGRGDGAPSIWTLEVLPGSAVSTGVVASGSIENNWDVNVLGDVDVSLLDLTDNHLDAGETVTFRLTASGSTGGRHLDFDNVGVSSVTVGDADSDGNGLPDWWEELYFGSTGQVAEVDSDGDGLTNGDELIAGTDPSEFNSAFGFHDFGYDAGGFTVRWDSYSDRTYQVMKGSSLLLNDWTSITGPLPGTGGEMSFTDPAPVLPSIFFYKLQVSRP